MAVSRVQTSSVLQGFAKYRSMLAGNSAYIPSSYESIASVTASGGESSISFSSIVGTYSHLQIRTNYKTSANVSLQMRFNGDTSTSSYAMHYLYGSGASVAASGSTSYGGFYLGDTPVTDANVAGVAVIDIIDYASTTKNKVHRSFSGYDANGSGILYLTSGVWLSTSALTSIQIKPSSGTFNANSVFSLYGIKGA